MTPSEKASPGSRAVLAADSAATLHAADVTSRASAAHDPIGQKAVGVERSRRSYATAGRLRTGDVTIRASPARDPTGVSAGGQNAVGIQRSCRAEATADLRTGNLTSRAGAAGLQAPTATGRDGRARVPLRESTVGMERIRGVDPDTVRLRATDVTRRAGSGFDPVGQRAVRIGRSGRAEPDTPSLCALNLAAPRSPPRAAPLFVRVAPATPATPAVAVRVALAESEPLVRPGGRVARPAVRTARRIGACPGGEARALSRRASRISRR